MSRIGFTTTIPIEILFAAGKAPVDLNSVFNTHPQKNALVEPISQPKDSRLRGVARNGAIVKLLSRFIYVPVVTPKRPEFKGAIGCAIVAREGLESGADEKA